jgi:hypothetical protein
MWSLEIAINSYTNYISYNPSSSIDYVVFTPDAGLHLLSSTSQEARNLSTRRCCDLRRPLQMQWDGLRFRNPAAEFAASAPAKTPSSG